VEFCLLHHGVLRGKFRWNLQLHLPPWVEFTPCFLAGNTTKCSSKPVVFPYFTTRKYHPSGILGTTPKWGGAPDFSDPPRSGLAIPILAILILVIVPPFWLGEERGWVQSHVQMTF
jgi:hypothetical protein